MLILISLLDFIAFIILLTLSQKNKNNVYYKAFMIFTGALFIITAGVMLPIFAQIHTSNSIDKQISIYVDANNQIEQNLKQIVENYNTHEDNKFYDVILNDNDNVEYINIIALIPNLKNNDIVKEQISTYNTYSKRIIELEVDKAYSSALKWILYFGK